MNDCRVRVSLRLSALTVILFATPVAAQLEWQPLVSPASPAARYGHAMARYGFLFGGRDGAQAFGDTWGFDNLGDWQPLAPASAAAPSPRHGHALDSGINTVLLFGGASAAGAVNAETWEWNQSAWRRLAPAQSPSARAGHAMAYDWATSSSVLLFGGRTAKGLSDETWQFDGVTWSLVPTSVRPPAREGHRLQAIWEGYLLFGGTDGSTTLTDTWLFENGAWRSLAAAPIGRAGAAVTRLGFERNRHVFVGGRDAAGTLHTDLHERQLDGTWLPQPQTNRIAARADAAISARLVFWNGTFVQGAVLFGGRDVQGRALGDAWVLRPTHPASSQREGVGCGPGAWGNTGPDLFLRPLITGNTEDLSVYTRSPSTPVAVGVAVGGAAVPPVCGWHVQPQVVLVGVTSSVAAAPFATFPLTVPFVPAFAGALVDLQGVALEPAGPNGLAISHVLHVQLGS